MGKNCVADKSLRLLLKLLQHNEVSYIVLLTWKRSWFWLLTQWCTEYMYQWMLVDTLIYLYWHLRQESINHFEQKTELHVSLGMESTKWRHEVIREEPWLAKMLYWWLMAQWCMLSQYSSYDSGLHNDVINHDVLLIGQCML